MRYGNAAAVAADALKRFDALLEGVLNWQQAIYRADLPNWLRDGLVQSLHSLSKKHRVDRQNSKGRVVGLDWLVYSQRKPLAAAR